MSHRAQALVIAMLALALVALSVAAFRDGSGTELTSRQLQVVRDRLGTMESENERRFRDLQHEIDLWLDRLEAQIERQVAAASIPPELMGEIADTNEAVSDLGGDVSALEHRLGDLGGRITEFSLQLSMFQSSASAFRSSASTFHAGLRELEAGTLDRNEDVCNPLERNYAEILEAHSQVTVTTPEEALALLLAEFRLLRLEVIGLGYGCELG